jgi:hypothetical protein
MRAGSAVREPDIYVMKKINSIKPGLIAIATCIATVSLSLAQTPRTGTSRSNQTAVTTHVAAAHGSLSGNSSATLHQGRTSGAATNTRTSANAKAHTGTNVSAIRPINPLVSGVNPGISPAPGVSPLPNNDPLGPNFSQPGQTSPSPTVPPQ